MSTITDGEAVQFADRAPAEVFPPGEFLRDELEARGWTQMEFAEIIGRPVRLVNEIIGGKKSITPTTAREIGAALGTSPILWLNLDAAYQLHRNAGPVPARIAKEARIRELYPIREMLRRGWIEPSDSADVLESRVLQFFRIPSLDVPPSFAHAARKTAYSVERPPVQNAWLFRVRQIAEAMVVPAFNELKLRTVLDALKELLAAPELVRQVPRLLGEAGIRLVIVEPLPGSKIDGVCFWLDQPELSPVIGLSLRFDRIDNFWFVLRHELEHVMRGHGKEDAIVDSDVGDPSESLPPEEHQANTAAAEFCTPAAELEDFVARVHVMDWEARLVGFAQRMGIHPGIVAGQLRRFTKRYDILGKHLVKIRQLLVSDAISDGYGKTFTLAG